MLVSWIGNKTTISYRYQLDISRLIKPSKDLPALFCRGWSTSSGRWYWKVNNHGAIDLNSSHGSLHFPSSTIAKLTWGLSDQRYILKDFCSILAIQWKRLGMANYVLMIGISKKIHKCDGQHILTPQLYTYTNTRVGACNDNVDINI